MATRRGGTEKVSETILGRTHEVTHYSKDDDGSASDPHADDVSDQLADVLDAAKSVNFTSEKQVKDFQGCHEKHIKRAGKHKRTILHEMVDATHDLESLRPFLTWLLATYPTLLEKTDNREKETPLCFALSRRKPNLFEFFVKSGGVARAIQIPSKRSSCLHVAIRDYPQYVPLLLEKAEGSEGILTCQDDDGNTPLHIAVRVMTRAAHLKVQLSIVEQLVVACPSAMDSRNKKGESPYQYRCRLKKSTGPIPYGEDPVADFLRLYSMRHRKRSATVDFLYGDRQVHEIEFSLDCPSITEEDLHKLVSVLKFESILLYVELPKLSVESEHPLALTQTPRATSIYPRQKLSPAIERGKGARDFEIIFKALQDKGVRKILKVIIEDDKGNPHSDDVIEKALRPFDIEEWDWKKFDMCSDVIYNAAPNLREVSLYSSGNNAVLRSWSAPDGLAKFTDLNTVNISVRQGCEPRLRMDANIKNFVGRLKTLRSDIKVVPKYIPDMDGDGDASASQQTDKPLPKKHQWLASMENFAKFIQNIKEDDGKDVKVQETVKVALIDDGIDTEYFYEHIACGVSFCSSDGSGKTKGYYVAPGGHGTLMATLITEICPMVKLYIARLDEYSTVDGGRQITARSAVQAIRWATHHNVDCISMSWTIEETPQNKADLEDLQSAIRAAEDKKILLFGAATDQGAASSMSSYPGCLPSVFCIGAATATGRKWEWVSDDKVNFLFPGEKVLIESRRGLRGAAAEQQMQQIPPSGSSIATALATGLAALILYCVEVVSHERRRGLRDFKHMDRAFKALCREGTDNYTKVWDVFGGDLDDKELRGEWQGELESLVKKLLGD